MTHTLHLSHTDIRKMNNTFKKIGNQALDTSKRISKDVEKTLMNPVNMMDNFSKGFSKGGTNWILIGAVGAVVAFVIIKNK